MSDSCEEIEIENKTEKSRVLNAEEQASFCRIRRQLNRIFTQSAPNIMHLMSAN